jgi:hypothetical protein
MQASSSTIDSFQYNSDATSLSNSEKGELGRSSRSSALELPLHSSGGRNGGRDSGGRDSDSASRPLLPPAAAAVPGGAGAGADTRLYLEPGSGEHAEYTEHASPTQGRKGKKGKGQVNGADIAIMPADAL